MFNIIAKSFRQREIVSGSNSKNMTFIEVVVYLLLSAFLNVHSSLVFNRVNTRKVPHNNVIGDLCQGQSA